MASLLGYELVRINFSSNTTVDQLLGSIVPTVENGVRVFAWQDGPLLRALRKRIWVLFDEINLAPPEVLDGLVPLLDRSFTHFKVPGTDELIDLNSVTVLATMNPASTGGGRAKLPRSIANLFATVKLDPYSLQELKVITLTAFASLYAPADKLGKAVVAKSHVASFEGETTNIFSVHETVCNMVTAKTIGTKVIVAFRPLECTI